MPPRRPPGCGGADGLLRKRHRVYEPKYLAFLCVLFIFGHDAAFFRIDIVEGLQKRYAAVTTVKADFRQTYRAPGINQVESGVFWMKKPGLMRWEYRTPEAKLFVADGRESYLYTPDDRQVMVQRYSAADFHSTPLQFLLGQGNISASFEVSPETEAKPALQGTVLLRLAPRQAEAEYDHLDLEVDPRTYDIRRIVIHERTGNASAFLFTNMETNIKVSDSLFHFKIPKGVEVIRLNEK